MKFSINMIQTGAIARHFRSLILSGLFIFSVVTLQAQPVKGTVLDKVIAKVDNYIVLKSELERAYIEYTSRGEMSGFNTKCDIFESLIINKMMLAKAEIDSVVVSEVEVMANLNQRMRYMVAQIGSERRIEEYYGKSIDQFKEELRDDVKEQMIIERMQREITAEVKITPAEVRKFFSRIPKDSLPYFSTEVSVAQIVKNPTISRVQKDKARQQIMDLKRRIEAGESFAELAKEYSDDPGSAAQGGALGFWKRGELAPEYEAASLRMRPGEMSDPVETQFGIHLIQLIERRGNEYNTNHILIRMGSSELDVEDAKQYLDSLRTVILDGGITFEKAAKEYSDDKFSAASGGFILDKTGANRISVEDIDPVMFFTLDTMQVGTITKPIVFRQDDGSEAVRILFYKERMKPHQANLNDDYQKIQAAALSEKRNRILSKWFDEVKSSVYIDIDPEYDRCNILQ